MLIAQIFLDEADSPRNLIFMYLPPSIGPTHFLDVAQYLLPALYLLIRQQFPT